MKININNDQRIVTGIFKYDIGIQYTKGDFVIDGNSIYYVNTDINGDEKLTSNKYTEYSLINAIKDSDTLSNTDDNKLVTSNLLKSLINKYIDGLNYGGEVDNILASSDNSLDKFTNTCIYSVLVPLFTDYSPCGLPEVLDPNKSYRLLFRSFRLVMDYTYAVQELTDFENGVIYTRAFQLDADYHKVGNPTWNSFYSIDYVGNSMGVSNVVTSLRESYNELNSIFTELNRYVMIELSGSSTGKVCNLSSTALSNVKLLDVIVKYKTYSDGPFIQDTFRFNIDSGNQVIERTIYKVNFTFDSSGGLTITIIYQGNSIIDSNIHFDKIIGIKWN